MRFCPWYSLADAVRMAPVGPAVLQLRLADGLVDYPRGKSAMVHYDADEELSRALDRLRQLALGALWVRFATVENPRERLQRLLREFEDRFGAAPGA